MNTNFRKILMMLLVAAFAFSTSACRVVHKIGEGTESAGEKIQKEADQHTDNDDNEDNREHDDK